MFEKGGKKAWLIWTIANLMVIFSSSSQVSYAYINISLAQDLKLSIAQIALIGSFYTWIFASCQFFSGPILTIFGIRKIFLLLTSLILVGFLFFLNSKSIYGLFVAQFFIALGASFGFVGAGYAGGVYFGFEKYGTMFALTQSFASTGAFLSGTLYAFLIKKGFIWHEILMLITSFGFVVLALIAFFITDFASGSKINLLFFKNIGKMLFDVIRQKAVFISAISGGIAFGVFLSVAILWCPKLLIAMGFDEARAGALNSLNWIGIAIGCIFINKISDIFKSRRVIFSFFTIIQALSLFSLIFLAKDIFLVAFLIFLIGFSSSAQMLTFTMAGESVEINYVGTSASIVNGFMFIFTGLIMAVSGKVLRGENLESYQNVLMYLPILLLFVAVFIFLAKESYKKRI